MTIQGQVGTTMLLSGFFFYLIVILSPSFPTRIHQKENPCALTLITYASLLPDVAQRLLHEAGGCFRVLEKEALLFHSKKDVGIEKTKVSAARFTDDIWKH